MSAPEHDAAAKRQDSEAAAHAAKYDPTATTIAVDCGIGARKVADEAVCWSSRRNPTDAQIQHAREHGKIAAEHRAASQALRDAEAAACVGVADADRDMSPFTHREDILAVAPIDEPGTFGTSSSPKLVGATIVVRAVPRLTKERLQRIVRCHSARNAAVGFGMPSMAFCPLPVKGVEPTVVIDASASASRCARAIRRPPQCRAGRAPWRQENERRRRHR